MKPIVQWLLTMLYLHEQVIPAMRRRGGGSPTQYAEIMERLLDSREGEHCGTLFSWYRQGRQEGTRRGGAIEWIRTAVAHQQPALIEEHKTKAGYVLFGLTHEGRGCAEDLVKDLSDQCRMVIQDELLRMYRVRRKRGRMS